MHPFKIYEWGSESDTVDNRDRALPLTTRKNKAGLTGLAWSQSGCCDRARTARTYPGACSERGSSIVRDISERLLDIQDAITRIMKYTREGRDRYDHDELVQTWVTHNLYYLVIQVSTGLLDVGQNRLD